MALRGAVPVATGNSSFVSRKTPRWVIRIFRITNLVGYDRITLYYNRPKSKEYLTVLCLYYKLCGIHLYSTVLRGGGHCITHLGPRATQGRHPRYAGTKHLSSLPSMFETRPRF